MRTFPSASLPRPPPPRFTAQRSPSKNPSLFPTTVRFLELHGSRTNADCMLERACARAYACPCTSTRVCLDHWLSSTVVPNLTIGSFLFVHSSDAHFSFSSVRSQILDGPFAVFFFSYSLGPTRFLP